MGTPNPFETDLPPRDPDHPWPPSWHLAYEVRSGKPAFNFKAEHDPREKLVQYDLKNPYFGSPTDSQIWGWKATETYGKLRDLVALVMDMQATVKDMKVPVDDLAPAATDALLKSLQDALTKADAVTNLKTPDMFRDPDPPADTGNPVPANGK